MNEKSWKKKSSFDSLATIMRSHMDNLIISKLVTMVSTEIPFETTTVFMEANVVKKDILTPIFDVSNLSCISFLNGGGGIAKTPVSVAEKNRTKDLTFIRLSCTINAHNLDAKILQEPLCLSFGLKFL